MTAVNGQLVDEIREALDTARRAGQPVLGRPTFVRIAGATDHAVRKALANESTNSSGRGEQPAPAGEPATAMWAGGGRAITRTGSVFGAVAFVAANVLRTRSPALAAQIGTAMWPIGLLLSTEVLSHVRWPQGWHSTFRHRSRIVTVLLTNSRDSGAARPD